MMVTDKRTGPHPAGGIRNGGYNPWSNIVTDKRTGPHSPFPPAVTCVECERTIGPDETLIVCGGQVGDHTGRFAAGATWCLECAEDYGYRELTSRPWLRGKYHRDAYKHRCLRCNRLFIGHVARRYCTDECGELERNERRDRRQSVIPRPCAICQEQFTPPRSDGRYCSNACRQKAYRRRKATE